MATDPQNRLGPDGPVPTVEIRYSFDDERPSLVSLKFYWPRGPQEPG